MIMIHIDINSMSSNGQVLELNRIKLWWLTPTMSALCMLLYIYIYIYAHISLSLSLYIYIYIYICVYLSLSLYIYIYIHTQMHVCTPAPESTTSCRRPSAIILYYIILHYVILYIIIIIIITIFLLLLVVLLSLSLLISSLLVSLLLLSSCRRPCQAGRGSTRRARRGPRWSAASAPRRRCRPPAR